MASSALFVLFSLMFCFFFPVLMYNELSKREAGKIL
jgi:hypothetical protein